MDLMVWVMPSRVREKELECIGRESLMWQALEEAKNILSAPPFSVWSKPNLESNTYPDALIQSKLASNPLKITTIMVKGIATEV